MVELTPDTDLVEGTDPVRGGEEAESGGGGKKKILVVALVLALLGGGGGFFGYKKFLGAKAPEEAEASEKVEHGGGESELVSLQPLVLNLKEQGRYLKLHVAFELASPAYKDLVDKRTPQLLDAIITFVSSKSVASISTPEGKLHLKDEILLRANNVIGKKVFTNLYFTEFVTQ